MGDIRFSGLVCDNPECSWKGPHIKYDDWEDYINSPCPECGEVILTSQDFEDARRMISWLNLLEEFSSLEDNSDKGGDAIMEIKVHAGEVKINVTEK